MQVEKQKNEKRDKASMRGGGAWGSRGPGVSGGGPGGCRGGPGGV